jgi:hypothetical protein
VVKYFKFTQQRLRGILTCYKITMRNFVGGLIGVIIGSITIVILIGIPQPIYPEPYNMIWFLLAGSSALQSTTFNPLTVLGLYFLSWLIIGLVIGPFSKPGWNTLRTALWVGLINAVFALTALLLTNPMFWESVNRNIELLYQFSTSLLLSILALPSALPIATIIDRLNRQTEPPVPSMVQTVCECGAVFKSIPLICSECGRVLNSE